MHKLIAKIKFALPLLINFFAHFAPHIRHFVGTCDDKSSTSTTAPLTVNFTVCKRMEPMLRQACIMRLQFWLEARKAEREGRIVPATELPPPSQGIGLPTYRKATPAEKAAQPPPSVVSELYGCANTRCLCHYLKDKCVANESVAQLLAVNPLRRQSVVPAKTLARCKRMEYRMLSDNQRARFHAALLQLKNGHGSHEYDRLSFLHSNPNLMPAAHGGPTFLLWHREFLKRFEIALRAIDPSVCLPYWDVTIDQRLPKSTDSIMWSDLFLGAPDSTNKFIGDGFLANWITSSGGKIRRDLGLNGRLFEENEVNSMITGGTLDAFFAFTKGIPTSECTQSLPDVDESKGALELIHNFVHSWVGGHMIRLETSTEDPIFFIYHCFIDYAPIWEQWRQKWQTAEQRETQFPPDSQIVPCSDSENYRLGATMYPFQDPVVLNAVGLSNEYTNNLYTYETRPACTMSSGCGSPYLFCAKQHDLDHLCCAKIKLGGDCSFFQGNYEEPCFASTCVNGICTSVKASTEKPTTSDDFGTSSTTSDDFGTSSTTSDDVETSSATSADVGTSSTTSDDVETSSATSADVGTSSTTSDDVETSSATSADVATSSITTSSTIPATDGKTQKPSDPTTIDTAPVDETTNGGAILTTSVAVDDSTVSTVSADQIALSSTFSMPSSVSVRVTTAQITTNSTTSSFYTTNPTCCCVCRECDKIPLIKRLDSSDRSSRKQKSTSERSSSSSYESSSSSEENNSKECDGKHSSITTVSPRQTTKSIDVHLGSTTPSPTPPPPKHRVCHDGHECCTHWAAKGACKSAPRHMNTWCPGTCRFNGCRTHPKQSKKGCKNLYSECHRWAHYHESVAGTLNECKRNPHWMARNCARACRKCGATKPDQCFQNMPKDYEAPPTDNC